MPTSEENLLDEEKSPFFPNTGAEEATSSKRVRRPSLPKKIETEILVRSRRRCCLCFFLNDDSFEKKIQIAHIDRDPANNKLDNLVALCLEHHDDYDTSRSQSKGITAQEVKYYRRELEKTFNTHKSLPSLDENQIKWLSALTSRSTRNEKVNIREVWVELSGQLSKNFDPSKIDRRLCVSGVTITVLGRAFVDPKDRHVQETNLVAQAIQSTLIENPNIKDIRADFLAQKTGLEEIDVANILESMAGFMGGGYFHTSGTSYSPSGWASINIDDKVLRDYIHFESVEKLLKEILESTGD